MKLGTLLGLLAAMAASHAMAAEGDCPAPPVPVRVNETLVIDPATGEGVPTPLPPGCKGVNYATSFGAFPKFADDEGEAKVVSSTTPKAKAEDKGLPDGMTEIDAQPEAQSTETDMNYQQLRRIGELDAMQGKPLDMSHANDLGYMQGYTQGQAMRQDGRGGGVRGFGR